MIAQTEEATLVSTWQALVGTPITNQFLEWPADLFAITDVILARSEADFQRFYQHCCIATLGDARFTCDTFAPYLFTQTLTTFLLSTL